MKIKLGLKYKIYKNTVCCLFTYGCEVWNLTKETSAAINGVNVRCLNRFTHQDSHTEASERSRSYDLVKVIRGRRLK